MKFLSPGYLFGLALMAVPVIIHLWFRRRMKRVPFSSLEFLKKTEARKLGWLRLREILILACRCLFVGLLFFSLSRPRIGEENRRASVFLVLDNTYSMGYSDNFLKAKEACRRLISAYAPNSEFLVCGMTVQDSAPAAWSSPGGALARIAGIPLTFHTGSIKRTLERSPAKGNSHPLEYVYVGDGQETNFRGYEPMPDAKFYWVRIRTGQNAGVVSFSPREPVRSPGEGFPALARLGNYSPRLWPGRIEVESGPFFMQQDCRLPPWQETGVEASLPQAVRCGRLVWQTDSLAADNEYFFAFPEARILQVLIVGRPGFLERSLDLSRSRKPVFKVRSAERLGSTDIRAFDAVILDGLPDLSEAEAKRLENYLGLKKRAVLCFLGDRVGENLRKFLDPCVEIGEPVLPRGFAVLERVDLDDYAFSAFQAAAGLKEIKIFKYWDLRHRVRAICGVGSSSDLIAVKDNLTVIGTRFDPEYTDLVYQAAFVPLAHRLVLRQALAQADRGYLVGGRSEHVLTLTGPQGRNVGNGEVFDEPGLYSCEGETVAVNVAPEEGSLKPMADNLRKSLGIRELDLDRRRGAGDLSWLALVVALAMVLLEQVLLLV